MKYIEQAAKRAAKALNHVLKMKWAAKLDPDGDDREGWLIYHTNGGLGFQFLLLPTKFSNWHQVVLLTEGDSTEGPFTDEKEIGIDRTAEEVIRTIVTAVTDSFLDTFFIDEMCDATQKN